MLWQKENTKRVFEENYEILQKMYEYFDLRAKSADVTADELQIIKEGIDKQLSTLEDLSNAYVDAAQQLTDYIVNDFNNAQLKYSSIISHLDLKLQDLEFKIEVTPERMDKYEALESRVENYREQAKTYQAEMDAAHKARMDWQNDLLQNEQFGDTYKKLFETFDLESWFDANGEYTARYYADITSEAMSELISASGVELEQFGQVLQAFKQEYVTGLDNKRAAELNAFQAENELQQYHVDLWLESQQKIIDVLNFRYNKQQSIIDGLQAEYSLNQQIRQVMSDANNEIRANKDLKEWLDDDTRKLLFNEDDYSALVDTCNQINADMARDYAKYQKELSKLDRNDWYQQERLTAEYNRQLAIHQEQLELANQELAIAKKQAEYDNRAKERDTQIILGNRIVNVADPDELYKIAKEKAVLESDYENTQQTFSENATIRGMQSKNDITKEQAASVQNITDMWNNAPDAMKKQMYEFLPTLEEINLQLLNFATMDIPKFRDMMEVGMRDLIASMDVGTEIGIGTDLSEDNSQLIYDFQKLVDMGIITNQGYIKTMIVAGDTTRERKRAADEEFGQYESLNLGGQKFEPDYHLSDQQQQKRREEWDKIVAEFQDYSAAMNKIIDAARSEGREFTPSEEEELARLETQRNKKIWDYGLNYEQTSDYGGQKFTIPLVEGDFEASIQKYLDYVNTRAWNQGILSTGDIKQLREWENARNYKIWANDLDLPQTSRWNDFLYTIGVSDGDYAAALNIIKQGAAATGWTEKSKKYAEGLETERNFKIGLNNLSYDQPSDVGGIKFDAAQSDYMAAMKALDSYLEKYGSKLDEAVKDKAKAMLKTWEEARNKKLIELGKSEEQTSQYGGQKFLATDSSKPISTTDSTDKTKQNIQTPSAPSALKAPSPATDAEKQNETISPGYDTDKYAPVSADDPLFGSNSLSNGNASVRLIEALQNSVNTGEDLTKAIEIATQCIQNNNSNNTVSIKVDGGVHIDTPLDKDFANEIAYGIIDGVQMNYDINKNINH